MKKKILFCIHALGGGGAEKVLINLIKGLDSNKYEITLLTIVNSGIYVKDIPQYVKHISLFTFRKKNNADSGDQKDDGSGSLLAHAGKLKMKVADVYSLFWRFVSPRFLYKLVIKEKYDVEVAFLEGPSTKLISGSQNDGSHKVAWIHVDTQQEGKSHTFYRTKREEIDTYSRFDQIIAVSNRVRNSAADYLGIDQSDIFVLRNPIDVDEIREKASQPLRSAPVSHGAIFCAIGRLCNQKAFDRLIEASSILRNEGFIFTVWILGEGPNQESLDRLITSLNLVDMVYLLGYKNNPYPYMKHADAFVCSSLAEGFSTTATEAASLGKPIITTDCAGMDELGQLYDGVEIVQNSIEGLVSGLRGFLLHKRFSGHFKDGSSFGMAETIDAICEQVLDVE